MTDPTQGNDIPLNVRSLVDGYCANTLGDDEYRQLESYLLDNELFQTYFLGYMAVHSGLHWSLRSQSPVSPSRTLPMLVSQASGSSKSASFGGILGSSPPLHGGSLLSMISHRWFGVGAILSTVLLVSAAIFIPSRRSAHLDESSNNSVAQSSTAKDPSQKTPVPADATHPVARVDRLESQVLVERAGAKHEAVVGMEILSSDSLDVPTGSSADLTLIDHSLAKLGPRTTFAFSSRRAAILREGFVQIDARHRQGGEHLAISTPEATTEIQSAWMAMAADGNRTQIRVAEGSVLASRLTDGAAVEISEGYCSTIAQAISLEPRPSGNGAALFVVTAKALRDHEDWGKFDQILIERIVGDRLWRSAIPVRMRTYDELQASDLEDCSLVVLSLFPRKSGIEQKLIDLKVPELATPIVCLEPIAFPALGLTGPNQGVDFGFDRGPLVVDIVNPDHPLAAGFVGNGLKSFAYRKAPYGYGQPPETAQTIVRPHKRADRGLLFAYEQGDAMFKGVAPARRVGLFMIPIGADYDFPGLDLMDAAIDWCLESSSESIATALHPRRTAQIGHAVSKSDLSKESSALDPEAAATLWNAESVFSRIGNMNCEMVMK